VRSGGLVRVAERADRRGAAAAERERATVRLHRPAVVIEQREIPANE
jgi:hypothetical protein